MSDTNLSLWNFSLNLYACPEVAAECLVLQDNKGIDVNVLLWCLWLEVEQKRLTPQRLHQAGDQVRYWVEAVIIPLRNLRRQLKKRFGTTDSSIEMLRQTIKQAELDAEQQEQRLLQMLAETWEKEAVSVLPGDNLRLYLTQSDVALSDANAAIQVFTRRA